MDRGRDAAAVRGRIGAVRRLEPVGMRTQSRRGPSTIRHARSRRLGATALALALGGGGAFADAGALLGVGTFRIGARRLVRNGAIAGGLPGLRDQATSWWPGAVSRRVQRAGASAGDHGDTVGRGHRGIAESNRGGRGLDCRNARHEGAAASRRGGAVAFRSSPRQAKRRHCHVRRRGPGGLQAAGCEPGGERNRLLLRLETQGAPPLPRTFAVLERGDCEWAEHVDSAPCEGKEDEERYFARAGALLCLVHVLRGTDCHADNLIPAGEHPILIDLEHLLAPVCVDPAVGVGSAAFKLARQRLANLGWRRPRRPGRRDTTRRSGTTGARWERMGSWSGA